jgi:HEPN domain-containing protein
LTQCFRENNISNVSKSASAANERAKGIQQNMSQIHANEEEHGDTQDELERMLIEGVSLQEAASPVSSPLSTSPRMQSRASEDEDDDEHTTVGGDSDVQGAFGLFAEASQDLATAGVELGLGRHFACADFCNQAVEKAAQSVSLLRFGRRSTYNHDLRALGELVGAPAEISDEMATLTPFHPEAFYADTPPEEADEVISAEQASDYIQRARRILRWARNIVLNP